MSETGHMRFLLLVQADHDGELSVAEAADLEAHVATCPECQALRAELAGLSARLRTSLPRHAAPQKLRAQLEAQIPSAQVIPFRPRPWRALGLAMAGGIAVAASVALWVPRGEPGMPYDEAVADHIRALQPGHLMDVASTDQHTVKPWFDGRIDYAPPVRDFAGAGFPLVGGRLDYMGGRPVAALVYRRDKHMIDVFVAPQAGSAPASVHEVRGYNVVSWVAGGMRYAAVSDLNTAELMQFARMWHQPAT